MKVSAFQTLSPSFKLGRSFQLGRSSIALLSLLALSLPVLAAPVGYAEACTRDNRRLPPNALQQPLPRRLPPQVKTAVLQAYAQSRNIPIDKLQVTGYSWQLWPDTCLGLGRPEEGCGKMMVNGLRVEVSDGSYRQSYRTDTTGENVRLEETSSNVTSLPQAVAEKVRAIAAKDLGIPMDQLTVVDGRSQIWDGCLGVASADQACTRIGIPGWQVIVAGPQQYWMYHLDQTATQVKRNPTTSGKGNLVPSFWQPDPSWISKEPGKVLFQSITTGGIAGQAYKTVLLKNGQVLRIAMQTTPPKAPTLIRQLSPQEVKAFLQTLNQNELEDFSGLSYPTTRGADYYTIALMMPGRTQGTQYADIVQDQTPLKLQHIIQAWNHITRSGSR